MPYLTASSPRLALYLESPVLIAHSKFIWRTTSPVIVWLNFCVHRQRKPTVLFFYLFFLSSTIFTCFPFLCFLPSVPVNCFCLFFLCIVPAYCSCVLSPFIVSAIISLLMVPAYYSCLLFLFIASVYCSSFLHLLFVPVIIPAYFSRLLSSFIVPAYCCSSSCFGRSSSPPLPARCSSSSSYSVAFLSSIFPCLRCHGTHSKRQNRRHGRLSAIHYFPLLVFLLLPLPFNSTPPLVFHTPPTLSPPFPPPCLLSPLTLFPLLSPFNHLHHCLFFFPFLLFVLFLVIFFPIFLLVVPPVLTFLQSSLLLLSFSFVSSVCSSPWHLLLRFPVHSLSLSFSFSSSLHLSSFSPFHSLPVRPSPVHCLLFNVQHVLII